MPMMTVENEKRSYKTIYEVIDKNYFKEGKTSTDDFIQIFNSNPNEPHIIPN